MRKIASFTIVLVTLTACAAPSVDRTQATFDTAKYDQDLAECRGGHLIYATAESLKVAFIGSLVGSVHGVTQGAIYGDSREGAAIGAIAGAVLGFGVGASNALNERDELISACLRERGYQVEVS